LALKRSTTESLLKFRGRFADRVGKKINAPVKSASETILDREAWEEHDQFNACLATLEGDDELEGLLAALEREGELEAYLEALAELEEDSVGLDKNCGNLERHSKRESHYQEAPGDGKSDETNLRLRLENAFVRQERGDRFLPAGELERLLTEQAIRQTILASNPNSPILADALSATRPGDPSSHSLRKLFAILTLLDRVSDISRFLSKGVRDESLPISEKLLKDIWSEDDPQTPTEFHKTQWQVLAPFFETGSAGSPRVFHYLLDDRAILPFYSPNDTSIRRGYRRVRKVRIHESHISPSFLACGVSSILHPPTCLYSWVYHSC
jgi:hypothetical protein